MSKVKTLLDELRTREKDIFIQDFEKSALKAKDVTEIGKQLGIKFPASYKEFLRTYQIPSAKIYICFCGDSYAGSFDITFSRAENKYIDSEEDEKLIELDWTNYDTSSVDAFIKSFHEKNDGSSAWAEAGFIFLGEFRGYQIYLDGKEDIVYSIYHEDMYECEDYEDPKAVRECMEENAMELCDNFEQFLSVICTGKPYDEDEHELYGVELSEDQTVETQTDFTSCIITVGEASDTPIKNRDKIGGYPTYLPDKIPEKHPQEGFFLMELYNHGFADSDIICWQLYCMKESASYISHVIEIHKGAPLYDDSSNLIRKRRWLHEFPLFFEPCDPKKIDETTSRLGGKVPKAAKSTFTRKKINYLGTITEHLISNQELELGYNGKGIIAFGFDTKGKLYVDNFV